MINFYSPLNHLKTVDLKSCYCMLKELKGTGTSVQNGLNVSVQKPVQALVDLLNPLKLLLNLMPIQASFKVLQNTFEEFLDIFTAKYEIFQLYPNGHSFFFTAKYKILKTVPKRPFFPRPFFWLRNTKFLKSYPNGHSIFDQEMRNF